MLGLWNIKQDWLDVFVNTVFVNQLDVFVNQLRQLRTARHFLYGAYTMCVNYQCHTMCNTYIYIYNYIYIMCVFTNMTHLSTLLV